VVEGVDVAHGSGDYGDAGLLAMRLKLRGICGSSGWVAPVLVAVLDLERPAPHEQRGAFVTIAPIPWFHSTVSLCTKVASDSA